MSVYLRVPRNETEAPVNFTLSSGGPVSGATVVYAVRDGDTPDSWLDFNDNTFKTAGWTTRQAAMTGSGTQAGLYTAVPGLDLSAITNLPAATDVLVIEFEVTAPAGVTGITFDYLLIDDRLEDETFASDVWSESLPGAFGAGTAGFILGTNLDVTVSSRNSVVPMTAALSQTEHDATQAAIAALNDPSAAAVATAVWSEALPGAFGGGTAGFILGTNLDAAISSRSVAGDAMALTAAAVDAIWDEPQAGHTTAGTFGFFLDAQVSLAGTSPGAVADAVWDEARADHVASGSMGEYVRIALDILAGDTRVIDDGGGNWVEEHLDFETGAIVRRRYDLFGFDQTSQITNSNNPFANASLDPNAGFMFRERTL